MPAQNSSDILNCGFGGCKAPERPLPLRAPGSREGAKSSTRRQGEDTLGQVFYLGFGGCRAPGKPEAVQLPGADREVLRQAA